MLFLVFYIEISRNFKGRDVIGFIFKYSPYRAVNILHHGYKNQYINGA